jgi:hypothetical protein
MKRGGPARFNIETAAMQICWFSTAGFSTTLKNYTIG